MLTVGDAAVDSVVEANVNPARQLTIPITQTPLYFPISVIFLTVGVNNKRLYARE